MQGISDLIHRAANNSGKINISPITLKCTETPKFLHLRSIAYGLREPVLDNLNTFVRDGILERVNYSRWGTPIVVVRKANGSVIICGDYRITVNPCIHQVACFIPEPEDLFAKVEGATMFSKIDLMHFCSFS